MSVALFRRSLSVALLIAATACASSGSSNAASTSSSRHPITESKLPTSGTDSAYDAIQRLRPDFIRAHPAQSYNLSRAPVQPAPLQRRRSS